MINPFHLLLVLVTPPFVAPLLLVWFFRVFGERAARVAAKVLLILFGGVFVICLAALALFGDAIRNGQESVATLIGLSILAGGAGALGTGTGLASLGLLGKKSSPSGGG